MTWRARCRDADSVGEVQRADVPAFTPAVHLVGGEPAGPYPRCEGPGDHRYRLLRLGRELALFGHPGHRVAFLVRRPVRGEVQSPVDDHTGGSGDGREVDGDWRVEDRSFFRPRLAVQPCATTATGATA